MCVILLIVNKSVNYIIWFTFFIVFVIFCGRIKVESGDIMEKIGGNSYSHGNFRVELFVILLAVVLIVLFAFPKAKSALLNVKLNGAIESANSYKESVNNYYVSQLLFDNNFKLDGFYSVVDGNLVSDSDIYNIMIGGNTPYSGYLDYENNVLKNGCISVGSYSVNIVDGNVDSAFVGNCETEVALGI